MKVTFVGTITRDVEVSTTRSGKPVSKTSVAENTGTRKLEDWTYQSDSSFYNIEAYSYASGKLASYPKGTQVFIDWELTNVSYKDKEWKNRSYLKITVLQSSGIRPLWRYSNNDNIKIWNEVPLAPAPVGNPPVKSVSPPVTPAELPSSWNPINPGTEDEWVNFDFSGIN